MQYKNNHGLHVATNLGMDLMEHIEIAFWLAFMMSSEQVFDQSMTSYEVLQCTNQRLQKNGLLPIPGGY